MVFEVCALLISRGEGTIIFLDYCLYSGRVETEVKPDCMSSFRLVVALCAGKERAKPLRVGDEGLLGSGTWDAELGGSNLRYFTRYLVVLEIRADASASARLRGVLLCPPNTPLKVHGWGVSTGSMMTASHWARTYEELSR
jgi:hypothetical protein